jgi:glycosyltransferase involved in cell wall biosynthesis
MITPLVTAIVDIFSHEAFIEQALESVFSQGLSANDLEIIVVDEWLDGPHVGNTGEIRC